MCDENEQRDFNQDSHLDSHAIRTSRTKILSKFKMELDQFMVGLHYVISCNCQD